MSVLDQQADYEGGFYIESDGELEGGVNVASKLEDVHLSITSTTGFVSSTVTVDLNDDQIGDLQLALSRAMAARAEARKRRIREAA